MATRTDADDARAAATLAASSHGTAPLTPVVKTEDDAPETKRDRVKRRGQKIANLIGVNPLTLFFVILLTAGPGVLLARLIMATPRGFSLSSFRQAVTVGPFVLALVVLAAFAALAWKRAASAKDDETKKPHLQRFWLLVVVAGVVALTLLLSFTPLAENWSVFLWLYLTMVVLAAVWNEQKEKRRRSHWLIATFLVVAVGAMALLSAPNVTGGTPYQSVQQLTQPQAAQAVKAYCVNGTLKACANTAVLDAETAGRDYHHHKSECQALAGSANPAIEKDYSTCQQDLWGSGQNDKWGAQQEVTKDCDTAQAVKQETGYDHLCSSGMLAFAGSVATDPKTDPTGY